MPVHTRLCVSLTTTPTRLPQVHRTVMSILQNDLLPSIVYVHVPAVFKRTGEKYPPIPKALSELPRVKINRSTPDIGPATKILPVTRLEKDPKTLIVLIDDDVLYPKDFLYTLMWTHLRYPGCAITGHGNNEICKFTKPIDRYTYETCMFAGFAGVLLERRMLNDWKKYIPFDKLPKTCFLSDDITLSNMVMQNGYKIVALKWQYVIAKLKFDAVSEQKDALHIMDENIIKYLDCLQSLRLNDLLHPHLQIAQSWYSYLLAKYGKHLMNALKIFSPIVRKKAPALRVSSIKVHKDARRR